MFHNGSSFLAAIMKMHDNVFDEYQFRFNA